MHMHQTHSQSLNTKSNKHKELETFCRHHRSSKIIIYLQKLCHTLKNMKTNQCKTSEKQQYAEQSSIDFTFQLEGWKYEHTTARMTAKITHCGAQCFGGAAGEIYEMAARKHVMKASAGIAKRDMIWPHGFGGNYESKNVYIIMFAVF